MLLKAPGISPLQQNNKGVYNYMQSMADVQYITRILHTFRGLLCSFGGR